MELEAWYDPSAVIFKTTLRVDITLIFSYGEMVSRLTVNQLLQVRVLLGELTVINYLLSISQLVRGPVKRGVLGSSPSGKAKY